MEVRSDSKSGPLTGVRVIELATVLMAPLAAQILGDMGADVIKVEGKRLDSGRVLGGSMDEDLSGMALNLQRNKRSIRLDLKQDGGRDVLLRLIDTADVFITNMRPAALARLRLDYQSVSALRPQLIYCEAHGFRTGTEDAERPAFDDIIQAETGMPRMGEKADMEVQFIPAVIADKLSGLYVAQAVLGALFHHRATGRGQRVEVAMFDAVLSFNLVEHLAAATKPGGETGYSRILTKHRGPHRTKDGFIAVMPYSDRDWKALYEAVGRSHELDEECFTSHRLRLENSDKVYGSLARVMTERTTREWIDLCLEIGVPVAPVPSLDEIVEDAALHRGVIETREHPIVGTYRSIVSPIIYGETPMSVRHVAPLVGENTLELLAESRFTDEEIERLINSGAAVQSSRRPGWVESQDVPN